MWDTVSTNPKEARVSVAGYFDDSEWNRSGHSTAEYVVRSLRLGLDDDVLEIGCGAGRIGTHMVERCRSWTGADVSRNMLDFAAAEMRGLPGDARFAHLNGYDLDGLSDASFSAVYCSAVFMHLDEWDRYRYVQEAYRVLRLGGRLFVDNYNLLGRAGWSFFEETSALDVAIRPPNVSRSSTPQELAQYLTKAGFHDVRVEDGELFVTALGTKS